MEQIRVLNHTEIECRIGTINEKGLTLLLYKDARADMKILDEVYGPMNWQRTHEVIGGNLYCKVSIWDEQKKQWISKMDVGTESYSEKEKGQASDSFKRACVSWGIGRELYKAPFLWISANKVKIQQKGDRYYTYDKFTVKEISYNENREIVSLTVINQNGDIVYMLRNEAGVLPVPDEQLTMIYAELERTGVTLDTVLKRYGLSGMHELSEETCRKMLNSLRKTKSKG